MSTPNVEFPRPLYPPSHAKGPVPNDIDVVAVKRAISRAGFWPWQDFDSAYSEAFAQDGVRPFQQQSGLTASGNYGEATHNKLVATHRKGSATEWAFDPISIRLMDEASGGPPPPTLPPLGAVSPGGKPVLNHDCTHATSGIALYPAFDDAFGAGRTLIAPEPLVVTRVGTSRPGEAFYADGASGVRYWFGHLNTAPREGRRFAKGATIGTTVPTSVGGGPHVHVGVNVERLWGAGRQLLHRTNYTHGAPLIGVQLGRTL